MGIEGDCKTFLMETFPNSFKKSPPKDIQTVSIDMMQYLKSTVPDHVNSTIGFVKYLVRQITRHLGSKNGCMRVVANFDLGSPEVKKIVTHGNRYDKRCKDCKKNSSSVHEFAENCAKNCITKQKLKFKDGPHLSRNLNDPLPVKNDEWYRFSADSRNLRRELYPLIVNELLKVTCLLEHQEIILNGLPFKTIEIDIDDHKWEHGYCVTAKDTRTRVVPWTEEDLPIAFLEKEYHKVFSITAMPSNCNKKFGWIKITERLEMKNDIHEADNSVFFFSQFYPGQNTMISINDGDAFPIGLLRVAEDYRGSLNAIQQTWLRLPNKRKSQCIQIGKAPKTPHPYDYVNLTQLYMEITMYEPFKSVGVQSPVATIVFLIILSGTDFVKSFCKGIGLGTITQKLQKKKNETIKKAEASGKVPRITKGIWDTFLENAEIYSHMVQWYTWDMRPNPTAKRRIIIDEELFKMFTYKCYFNKYIKNDDDHNNLEKLRVRCSKFKIVANRLPSVDTINVWCRNASWNTQYWVNAWRNIYVDPFETKDDMSLWGFSHKGITSRVCAFQHEIDEKYKVNFLANKKSSSASVSPSKKQKVEQVLGEKIKELF